MHFVKQTLCQVILCWTASFSASTFSATIPAGLVRLFHGEILFDSRRDQPFDALVKFNNDFSPYLDTTTPALDNELLANEITVNDLQLAFGLGKLASENITAQLHSDNHWLFNHNSYQLALFYYKKNRPLDTIQTLNLIKKSTNKNDHTDIQYLRALAYIGVGKFNAATKILLKLSAENPANAYIQYNLGIALLQKGEEEKGLSILSSLGQTESHDIELMALKDKVNLQLGYHHLGTGKAQQAKTYFKRIQLEGPFSRQALVGSGWADFARGQIERALVPWTLLQENETLNDSSIEAKMALPYAYASLGAHGKAANLYGHAIDSIESEIGTIDSTIKSIGNGKLTQTLLAEFDNQRKDWLGDVLSRSEPPQYYLPLLLTTEAFRQLAENLHDLAVMNNRLQHWQTSMNAFNELITLKQKHYIDSIPETEKQLLETHKKINRVLARQQQISTGNNKVHNTAVQQLKNKYADHLEIRKAVSRHKQQLPQYKQQLAALSKKIKPLNNRVNLAIAELSKQIETIAIDTLENKRQRLENYRVTALFALAESYDFATRKQQ